MNILDKVNAWMQKMNEQKYKENCRKIIYETLYKELNAHMSCSFFSLTERRKMLDQILSQKRMLTEWEVLHVIRQSAHLIQTGDPIRYPRKDATENQIKEFANAIADKVTNFIVVDHENTISIPMQGVPEDIARFFNNKEIENGKFIFNSPKGLSLHLNVKGPLLAGGENAEAIRIDSMIQAILGLGLLLDFFNINALEESTLFDLDKINIKNPLEFFNVTYLFSKVTKDLSDKVSFINGSSEEDAKRFLEILSNTFSKSTYSIDVLYSLGWYCQSFDYGGDAKTKFVCRYIGFEALSAIWTRTGKNDKSSQDKLKYTISALLADKIDDLKVKEQQIKEVIDLRNSLFHGNKSKGDLEEFGRTMSQQYFRLGNLYKELLLHTLTKI